VKEEEEEEQLYIAEAGEKGRGVFARRGIPPGRLVMSFRGRERWIWDIPRADWEYTLQVDYDRYILPERGSPPWFLNHSCDPNCVLSGRSGVLSWRAIVGGEELTIDYSTNVGWDAFEMLCHCGSESCRRISPGEGEA